MGEKPVNTSPSDVDHNNNQRRGPSLGRKILAAAAATAALVGIGGVARSAMNDGPNPDRVEAVAGENAKPRPDADQQMPSVPTTPEASTTTAQVPGPANTVPDAASDMPIAGPSGNYQAPPVTDGADVGPGAISMENPASGEMPSSAEIGQAANTLASSFDQVYQQFSSEGDVDGRGYSQTVDEETGNLITEVMSRANGVEQGWRSAQVIRTQSGDLVGVKYHEVYSPFGTPASEESMKSTILDLGAENRAQQADFNHSTPLTQERLNNLAAAAAGQLAAGAEMPPR